MQHIALWSLIPFVIMLLGIAVFPMLLGKWWEKNTNKLIVSLLLSAPVAIYMIAGGMGEHLVDQMVFDYLPFIVLLLALFVITGGIHIGGDIEAKPYINTAILALGFLWASIMGTTGAAMLLIRPLLEINKQRCHKTHTVLFFIALIANCGGILSPLGDPPLFMLYLRGASFTWFLSMYKEWLLVGGILLLIYWLADRHYYRKEDKSCLEQDKAESIGLEINMSLNPFLLIGVICSVAFINESYIPQMSDTAAPLCIRFLREEALLLLTAISLLTTRKRVYEKNNFSWAPIMEVAVLFIGIFATMTPALMFLNSHAEQLGLQHPWQFFYSTGLLSSFLDNTPTAVAMHTVAAGLPEAAGAALVAGVPAVILRAIALGAVFFGSMTYIGNGPNFMVKSIAESQGIKMPSFFRYMTHFSLLVLLPVFIIVQLIFL